ncbi:MULTISPECIES: hypothetical protein [Microbacterium]|uniref:Uncharacterized protein n=1 Tax=Microbacterium marmarense TaxID=3122051 RepID=A0ABU8LSI6_9MICO
MDTSRDSVSSDLLSDLEVIEAQPLPSRSAAYDSLHDSLARKLESAPTTSASAGTP